MAFTINISIDQGSVFQYLYDLEGVTEVDVLSSTPYGSMKPEYDSNASLAVPFTAVRAGSNVTISLSSNTTSNASLMWPGVWVYDCILVDGSNNVLRFVQGHATVTPAVTTPPL